MPPDPLHAFGCRNWFVDPNYDEHIDSMKIWEKFVYPYTEILGLKSTLKHYKKAWMHKIKFTVSQNFLNIPSRFTDHRLILNHDENIDVVNISEKNIRIFTQSMSWITI